ncbi:Cyclopentanone 1,2-monooxygenase (CPMO) [Chamberlinius hualienensis]
MKPVVIIGAGFSGVITLKICLENGLDAVCYERMDHFGGLWRYRETVDVDGIPSVTKNTIIDTSKEVGAISDFPPPPNFPNYMHNTKMIEYLGSFIQTNRLSQRIKYKHEILRVQKADDYDKSGEWSVLTKNKESGEEEVVEAMAVVVCTGHHAYPNYPTFLGQSEFKGKIIHSHSLKDTTQFEGKKVVVVGAGNSAMDAASELSFLCKTVYISTRKGVWISPRVGPNGIPLDFLFTRVDQFIHDNFPTYWRYVNENYVNSLFDHSLYGLKPRHHIDQQHPSISDILPARILAGAVFVKGDIARFTPNGVIFKGDEGVVNEVDAVVLCTGYNIKIPFLPDEEESLPGAPVNNNVGLFARIFPVKLPHPTLAFVGMCQPIGPLFPLMEMQARWICQLLNDHKRPIKALKGIQGWPTTVAEREAEVKDYKKTVASNFAQSQRHTIEVFYVTYLSDLARKIGCYPNIWKYAITDPKLFWKLLFGPFVAYQFRLDGPHTWPEARRAILSVDERVQKAFGETGRKMETNYNNPLARLGLIFTIFFAIVAFIYVFIAN